MASFNLGHDIKLDVVDSQTNRVIASFGDFTHFSSEPITKSITHEPVSGEPEFDEVEHGWKGTLEYDRTSNEIDAFFANKEEAYFSNGARYPVTITETVYEKDGNVSQYRYTKVALKLDSAGSWKAADKVAQKVSFMASRRKKVV